MGCCYSFFCKEDGSTQGGEPNEASRLLADTGPNNARIQRVNSDDLLNPEPSTLPKKTDEQSALNKILQETATNVIDVAALDSHNLQQHEYVERSKLYRIRVQQLCASSRLPLQKQRCILQDIPAPELILSADPIDQEDVSLIKSSVLKGVAAINDIKIEHKEDLVVPFRISGL